MWLSRGIQGHQPGDSLVLEEGVMSCTAIPWPRPRQAQQGEAQYRLST
jgi:hypothetical protein